MTVQQLQGFVTLAEHLHFTKAADELYISQPNLSYSIQSLEQELGATLFERKGRKVFLTQSGKLFLPYANNALSSIRDGKYQLKINDDPSLISGTVRIACTQTINMWKLPTYIKNFYANSQNKNITISLISKPTAAEVIDTLRCGEADLIFTYPINQDMTFYPLFRQHLMLILPESHPLAERAEIKLSEIVTEPLITGTEDGFMYRVLLDMFAYSHSKPQIVMQTNSIWNLFTYVRSGFGISAMAYVPLKVPGIVFRKFKHPLNDIQISLAHMESNKLSTSVETVKNFMLNQKDLHDDDIAPYELTE